MGGSTSYNGMAYMRGNRADYNKWAELGNTGWSYKEVLPYFKKSENNLDEEIVKNNSEYHGIGGYLSVQRFPYADENVKNIFEACQEIGYKKVDLNGENQLGTMILQTTSRDGQRQSTNTAFIKPIRNKRTNLFIETEAYVTKIKIHPISNRAIGIEYTSTVNNSRIKKVALATKEVIISGGTVNSPQLLMLSGIGPAEDLQKLGIKVIKNSPVGRNLRDHVSCTGVTILLNTTITDKSNEEKTADLKQYLEKHNGPLSSIGPLIVNAFSKTKSHESEKAPNTQLIFLGTNSLTKGLKPLSYYDRIIIKTVLLTPTSHGNYTT
ncbi:glucose dehydrogenase [FAD, quinone]-like [Belonocnema kinseyi]|uniref:glucose dehydrogenase [FAD, quinone]-like n=1 Tax=Belonocnema kinseyi TaxID=2817044 RepID=UPI00143DE67E|nr:glucose dehydrogenase [FAD, quinone]-like [Belonocnema kinseyi]